MRCKSHPSEQGCNGVCAFCLSERLSALQAVSEEESDDRRESDHAPPSSSSAFPPAARSLSASRRRPCSAAGRWDPSHSALEAGPADTKPKAKRHKKRGRLSSFLLLFRRSKSRGKDPPPPPPPSVSKARISPSSSPWISAFRRKKKSRLFSVEDDIAAAGSRKACRTTIDRGLSPATSPHASPDSPEALKKAAADAVEQKACKRKRGRHLSKLAVFLSPLVRAKPRRCHRHERLFPRKFRGGNRHSLSNAPSLCPNRSRKIADFGRNR